MGKKFGAFISTVLVLHFHYPEQVLSIPYLYTDGTTEWSGSGNLLHVQNLDIVGAGPVLFFAKTLSDVNNNTTDSNSSVCKESNGQFEDPKFCDKWYECWEGKVVSSGQCNHGLMFNEKTSSCDYPSMVNCDGKEVNQPLEVDPGCEQPYGKFADPKDCRKYTVCHAGVATYYICEEGLAYDKDNAVCGPPSDPYCLQGPPNDIPEGEDVPEIPLDPETIMPVQPAGPGDSGSFPTVPEWPKGTKCPNSSSGFIPVVGDCKSVLVCIKGNGYLLTCPSGSYYHPSITSCKPGKVENCKKMHFYNANFKINEGAIHYTFSDYPLLPLLY